MIYWMDVAGYWVDVGGVLGVRVCVRAWVVGGGYWVDVGGVPRGWMDIGWTWVGYWVDVGWDWVDVGGCLVDVGLLGWRGIPGVYEGAGSVWGYWENVGYRVNEGCWMDVGY